MEVANVDWNEIQCLSSCSHKSAVVRFSVAAALCSFFPKSLRIFLIIWPRKKGAVMTKRTQKVFVQFGRCCNKTASENKATPSMDIQAAERVQKKPGLLLYVTCGCLQLLHSCKRDVQQSGSETSRCPAAIKYDAKFTLCMSLREKCVSSLSANSQ